MHLDQSLSTLELFFVVFIICIIITIIIFLFQCFLFSLSLRLEFLFLLRSSKFLFVLKFFFLGRSSRVAGRQWLWVKSG